MPMLVEKYPEFQEQIRELVEQHRKMETGRLRLAVYFAPPRRSKRDVFLLEVVDGFGGDSLEPEHRLFEFGYGSTPAFPLAEGASLRMVLTNPTEFEEAIRNHWKGIEELRSARLANQTTVIYSDPKGKRLWGQIK